MHWIFFCQPTLLPKALSRNAVATLPSALFVSDCCARCKLGVLVSAGAATC